MSVAENLVPVGGASLALRGAEGEETEARLLRIAAELRDQVVSRAFVIPMLPETADRLLRTALDPDVSVRDLEAEIRREPMIAAKVVSVANSSLYGNGSVTSLHQASLRLGATILRDLLSQVVAEAYVFTGRSRRLLRQQRAHAVAVAHLTRRTCARLDIAPDHAFLCGLFHDIGHPVLLANLAEHAMPGLQPDDIPWIVETVHPLVGDRVARAWGLPDPVAEVCRFHHCYRGSLGGDDLDCIVGVVAAADRLAYHVGVGSRSLGVDVREDPLWEELGLEGDDVESLIFEAASFSKM